jgi:hypothetical protein
MSMSDEESFLARWSRCKRSAAGKARDEGNQGCPAPISAPEVPAAPFPPEKSLPILDPAGLPPIEAIGAGSDIRAFLAPGVPAEMARAALRRARSADPAIRDFIGLSENSWDFTAPGGVPGFGSMTAEEVRRLVGRVMGEPGTPDSARPLAATVSGGRATLPARDVSPSAPSPAQDQQEQVRVDDGGSAISLTTPHEPEERERRPPLTWRAHGGALPK